MRLSVRVMAWLCGLIALAPALTLAAPVDAQKGELSALKDKIGTLRDDLARTEENHDEIADSLAASDQAISAAQRKLREIAQRRGSAEADSAALEQQRAALASRLADARRALGSALFRIYVEGGQAGTRRFLSGDEPNRLSRDAYYLELIAAQRTAIITDARAALAQMDQIIAQAQARKAELLGLEAEQRKEQETLLAERKKQRAVLDEVASQLRGQRKQIVTLQRDENRMEKLVVGLEKIGRESGSQRKAAPVQPTPPVAAKPAPAAVAPPAASASRVDEGARAPEAKPAPPARPLTPATSVSEPSPAAATDFANLKGRLALPVKGELKGRFGAPRAETGAVWHGIFIRSSAGQEVHAVARGKVAFADWLRGFGNLIIVDHGDGYMTVYGNNESLFKSPGDEVRAGEVIASVGASGGLEESGLYFEIRFRGQAQDPAKWTGQSR